MGSNREKSNIAIAILKKLPFLKGNKIISNFDGSNNILADCISSQMCDLNVYYSTKGLSIVLYIMGFLVAGGRLFLSFKEIKMLSIKSSQIQNALRSYKGASPQMYGKMHKVPRT